MGPESWVTRRTRLSLRLLEEAGRSGRAHSGVLCAPQGLAKSAEQPVYSLGLGGWAEAYLAPSEPCAPFRERKHCHQ